MPRFVEDDRLTDHDLMDQIAPLDRHVSLLGTTRNVTRSVDVNRGVVDRSVAVDRIEQILGRAVPRYRVEALDAPASPRSARVGGSALRVYRPRVRDTAPERAPVGGKPRGLEGS